MIVTRRPNPLRLFFVLRGSILPRIAGSLITCSALALAVTLSHGRLFDAKITLTPVPFSLIGLALAIFLGFRNSAAYDRYWEARKLWGELLYHGRSLARQLLSLTRLPEATTTTDARHVMLRRTIAFAHALRHQLRGSDGSADLKAWLAPAERAAVAASRSGTDLLLRLNSRQLGGMLRAGEVEPQIAAQIDQQMNGLTAVAAGCERIRSTPIPFAYTLLLHRTAYLYCFLLPFGLVDQIGFMTPFVVAIVAYTFFGLDAVGDEIEEPFGLHPNHLPLDALCRTLEINLLEAMGEKDLPPALQPVDGWLH
jgi:putative membrane protein